MRECKVNVKKNVDTSEEIAGTEEAKESHERIRSDVSIVAARENEWTVEKYVDEEIRDVEGQGRGHRDDDPKEEPTVTGGHVANADAEA
jgi:hypothetical protein